MEPPGTAPGSDPLITSAFMSIVPFPERFEYKGLGLILEGHIGFPSRGCGPQCNTLVSLLVRITFVLAVSVGSSSLPGPNFRVA